MSEGLVQPSCSVYRILTQNFTFSQYIDAVVTKRLYLLAQLKRQVLDLSELDSVFDAIIANKILYALPVCSVL